MSNDRYDKMLATLSQRGYISEDDVPTKDYEAVLKEMCELDLLKKQGDHYVVGPLAIEHGWSNNKK